MVQFGGINIYFTQEGHSYVFAMKMYRNNFILEIFLFWYVLILDLATLCNFQLGEKIYPNSWHELAYPFLILNETEQTILVPKNTKH